MEFLEGIKSTIFVGIDQERSYWCTWMILIPNEARTTDANKHE
jgi:hypothetical protein